MGQNTVTTAVAQNYQVSGGKSILSLVHSGDSVLADAVVSGNTPRLGNTGGVFSSEAVESAPASALLVREPDDTDLLEEVVTGEIAVEEDYGYFWRLCVDWLRLGFYYSEWRHKIAEFLRGERDRLAELRAAGFRETSTVEIEGLEFEILPRGARRYGVVLSADGVEVRLCPRLPGIPEVQVEFSGRWFLDHSLYQTVNVARRIASFFGEPERDLVSRLDLRVDLPVELGHHHYLMLRGHGARAFHLFRDTRTGCVGAISTGRSKNRDFSVRIYNKRLEAEDSGAWLACVRSFGVPDDVPVTRVEVELERGELVKLGIDAVADLHDTERLRVAWRRVVGRYVYLSPDDVRERSRVKVLDWWRRIQGLGVAYFREVPSYVASDVTTHRLRVGLGCLAGELVESGFADFFADREAAAATLADVLHGVLPETVEDFVSEVSRRITRKLAHVALSAAEDRLKMLFPVLEAGVMSYMQRKRRARRVWYLPVNTN